MLGTMLTERQAQQLAAYERRYRDLAAQLAEIGWIASGSVASRQARCGKANCACHAEPPRLHGPYWHFTAKVEGKTVNKRLAEHEAHLYQEWIANDRTLRSLLAEMRAIAAKAQALIVNEVASEPSKNRAETTSPQTRRTAIRRSG
jgi:hypothetical protein